MKKLRCIITGTGRCGTVYLARVLTESGIPCGHESVFGYKGIEHAIAVLNEKEQAYLSFCSTCKYLEGEWHQIDKYVDPNEIQAESSYMAAPFLTSDLLKDSVVIHLVRHPNKVVDSFVNHVGNFKNNCPSGEYTKTYEEFIYKYVPELFNEMSVNDRAALYYIRWNQMIESCGNSVFHRVEDSPKRLDSVLGASLKEIKEKNINSIKNTGASMFNVGKIDSKDIRDEFVEMGKRYGYDMGIKDFNLL